MKISSDWSVCSTIVSILKVRVKDKSFLTLTLKKEGLHLV